MVSKCARDFPGKPRHLYLDIEKHRNEVGGFDHDAEALGEPIYDSETGEMVDADGSRTRNRG